MWVRLAGANDVARVAAVEARLCREAKPLDAAMPIDGTKPFDEAALRERWWTLLMGEDELAVLLIAENETGASVGFAAAGAPLEGALGWDAELHGLGVLPEARGRGLGRALLRRLGGHLAEQGVSSLGVWLPQDAEAAAALLETLGGRMIGRRVLPVGEGGLETAILADPAQLASEDED